MKQETTPAGEGDLSIITDLLRGQSFSTEAGSFLSASTAQFAALLMLTASSAIRIHFGDLAPSLRSVMLISALKRLGLKERECRKAPDLQH